MFCQHYLNENWLLMDWTSLWTYRDRASVFGNVFCRRLKLICYPWNWITFCACEGLWSRWLNEIFLDREEEIHEMIVVKQKRTNSIWFVALSRAHWMSNRSTISYDYHDHHDQNTRKQILYTQSMIHHWIETNEWLTRNFFFSLVDRPIEIRKRSVGKAVVLTTNYIMIFHTCGISVSKSISKQCPVQR